MLGKNYSGHRNVLPAYGYAPQTQPPRGHIGGGSAFLQSNTLDV